MNKPEFAIEAESFSCDDNFSKVALEDYSKIQNSLPYVKLKMLEEAAAEKNPEAPDGFVTADFPESCLTCDFCHEREYDNRQMIQGKRFCGVENVEVERYCSYDRPGKPDWCPVKKIPEKCPMQTESGNHVIDWMYNAGWNACVDKMIEGGG